MQKKIRPKPKNWDEVMMRMAYVISSMSKDPSTQVGAVLVSPDRTRISVGYNGFPKQIPDIEEWWMNRSSQDSTFTKYELVRHAEMNAMTQAKTDLCDWTLYVTHHPCIECAKNIIAEGIKRVVYSESIDSLTMAIDNNKVEQMFTIAGVKFTRMQMQNPE